MTVVASSIKEKWMQMPDEYFEVLTFGELNVGQKFICLPSPGDNEGHGGFRGTAYIFTKTHSRVMSTGGEIDLPYSLSVPHGRAMNDQRQVPSDLPLSMPVLAVR